MDLYAHFREVNNALQATFTFPTFTEAWAFMQQVAVLAEAHNHHPDWRNAYNRVDITLSTHDDGDIITDKDRRLAEAIEGLLPED